MWYRESAVIACGYVLYTITRNAAPPHVATAQRHAATIYGFERWAHINLELTLNRMLSEHRLLELVASYYYATLHFAVTLAVLIWTYSARPERYRAVRTVLVASTLVALFVFWVFPLAPPRLTDLGFVDTIDSVHLWGGATWNSPSVASVSNEYAAMPSLHFAWAVWSAAVVCWLSRATSVRMLAFGYPVVTLAVVVATANHFLVDALGGLAVLAIAMLGRRVGRHAATIVGRPRLRAHLVDVPAAGLPGTASAPTALDASTP